MDNRAFKSNAAVAPPAAPAAPSVGYPKSGNAATNDPATTPGPYWYHSLGEELRAVITGVGLVPSLSDNTQLRTAITKMISSAAKTVRIEAAVFEASITNGEMVLWDNTNSRFDEAVADGTANNLAVGVADVTNGLVYSFGETPPLFSGLTPGARYYLSPTTPGAITATPPSDRVSVGIAKSATVLFVDIDAGTGTAANAASVLDRDTTIADVVNTTTETTVYSFTIPANTLGTDRMLRLSMIADYLNNSGAGSSIAIRVKLGATVVANYFDSNVATDASRRPVISKGDIAAAGATNAQRSFFNTIFGNPGANTGGIQGNLWNVTMPHLSIAADSTTPLTLTITAQHGVANASISFRAHTVHLEML